jgi:anti-anti-sigma factor
MKVDLQPHGMVTVLTPHGPLVGDELNDFRQAVDTAAEAKDGRVVIDMRDVPYLDSGAIELLLDLCESVGPYTRPRLAALDETCREALDLTRVLDRLDAFDSVDNAIKSYKQ